MLLKIRRFAIAFAIVIPAVAGLSMASASAAPAVQFAVHAAPLKKGPNSNITGSGSKVVYKPSELKGLSPVSKKDCATTDYTFSISNKTKVTQTVTYKGAAAFSIPAGEAEDICVFAKDTLTFGLKANKAAKLKTITK